MTPTEGILVHIGRLVKERNPAIKWALIDAGDPFVVFAVEEETRIQDLMAISIKDGGILCKPRYGRLNNYNKPPFWNSYPLFDPDCFDGVVDYIIDRWEQYDEGLHQQRKEVACWIR